MSFFKVRLGKGFQCRTKGQTLLSEVKRGVACGIHSRGEPFSWLLLFPSEPSAPAVGSQPPSGRPGSPRLGDL